MFLQRSANTPSSSRRVAGTYYLRIRALNAMGTALDSEEFMLQVRQQRSEEEQHASTGAPIGQVRLTKSAR